MNLEGISIKPIGGRPVIHRVSASWTTEAHGPVINEAEEFVREQLATMPPGESAKILETSQRAFASARSELAKLHDEESGILAERKDAVLNGSPITPIEKRLTTVQGKINTLAGRVEQLVGVVAEMEKSSKKEAAEAARVRIEALRRAAEAEVDRATENLANLADTLRPLLAAKARLEALSWQGQRLLSRSSG